MALSRIVLGIVVAAAATVLLAVPTIFGVATWKWALGALGAVLFVAAGRRR